MDYIELREQAAMMLINNGSFRSDLAEGYKLKIHETYPDAPRSPFFMNIRPRGVKGGTLTHHDYQLLGKSMLAVADRYGLFGIRRYWSGIPAAGVPIGEALEHQLSKRQAKGLRRFTLLKEESADGRKISSIAAGSFGPPECTQNVLLLDDLVTAAGTKLEAIEVVKQHGGSVTDLLVFLDRSQDVALVLKKHRVTMHAVWPFYDLLEFYLGKGKISRRVYETIIDYPTRLARYVKEHA